MGEYSQTKEVEMVSTLYIVPTPIGNLEDITLRALQTLKQVDLIAAEDTRRTGLLLQHFAIDTKMVSFHVHNEQKKTDQLILKLKQGLSIALVSDAGTPLINDPGYYLVKYCHKLGIRVTPLPGPCAAITALSATGISLDRFCYEGFLPAKHKKRQMVLQELIDESRTLIFYESPHRLLDTLTDMIATWGAERYVILARELTKTWESIQGLPIGELFNWARVDKNRYRGEIVLIVEGYRAAPKTVVSIAISSQVKKTLAILQQQLSLKKAAILTAEIYGLKKNMLYKYALKEQAINSNNNSIK